MHIIDAYFIIFQRVDWDRSYFVLRSIYDEAIGKMESEVSEVRVVQLQNGEYQGSIEISAHPHLFVGDSGCTKISAKSKILYSAIKHVNQTLGCGIIDLNCSILHHEENFISQLDQKIHGVWRCGQKLERLLLTSEDALLKNINHVTDNIRANECTMYVATTIASSASELARLKSKFYEAWSVFMNNLVRNVHELIVHLVHVLMHNIINSLANLSCCRLNAIGSKEDRTA